MLPAGTDSERQSAAVVRRRRRILALARLTLLPALALVALVGVAAGRQPAPRGRPSDERSPSQASAGASEQPRPRDEAGAGGCAESGGTIDLWPAYRRSSRSRIGNRAAPRRTRRQSGSGCPTKIVGSGLFATPLFPQLAAGDFTCFWQLSVLYAGQTVRLTLDDVQATASRACGGDYIAVADASGRVVRYCETQELPILPGENVYVWASGHGSPFGLRASFTSVFAKPTWDPPDPVCGGRIEPGVTFSTPNYPNPYPTAWTCFWVAQASPEQPATLSFSSFNVGNGSCLYDYVTVWTTEMGISRRFCGNGSPADVTTKAFMFILFSSDGVGDMNRGAGFQAVLTVGNCSPSGVCETGHADTTTRRGSQSATSSSSSAVTTTAQTGPPVSEGPSTSVDSRSSSSAATTSIPSMSTKGMGQGGATSESLLLSTRTTGASEAVTPGTPASRTFPTTLELGVITSGGGGSSVSHSSALTTGGSVTFNPPAPTLAKGTTEGNAPPSISPSPFSSLPTDISGSVTHGTPASNTSTAATGRGGTSSTPSFPATTPAVGGSAATSSATVDRLSASTAQPQETAVTKWNATTAHWNDATNPSAIGPTTTAGPPTEKVPSTSRCHRRPVRP